jgi:predicted dehydrogenase
MKVAVAGLGWWGKQIISCLSKTSRFKVLYGVDPAPPADVPEFRKAHQFTLAANLDEALSDPLVEGVILATPHALHEEQALRVIAAGKNLFCEKPLTMTGDGAKRIVAACEKAGKVLGVGHERRWEPAFEELQRLVGAGALGAISLFEANVSHDNFRKLLTQGDAGGRRRVVYEFTDTVTQSFEAWADAVEGRAPYRLPIRSWSTTFVSSRRS